MTLPEQGAAALSPEAETQYSGAVSLPVSGGQPNTQVDNGNNHMASFFIAAASRVSLLVS